MKTLDVLTQAGFTIEADGDKLIVSPKSGLTDEVRAFIRDHKATILAELTKSASPEAPPSPDKGSGQVIPPYPSPATEKGAIREARDLIEEMLAGGPKPYGEILKAIGGDEDTLRESIRGWDELVAFDDKGVWAWEIRKSRFDLRGSVDKIPRMWARQNLFWAFR